MLWGGNRENAHSGSTQSHSGFHKQQGRLSIPLPPGALPSCGYAGCLGICYLRVENVNATDRKVQAPRRLAFCRCSINDVTCISPMTDKGLRLWSGIKATHHPTSGGPITLTGISMVRWNARGCQLPAPPLAAAQGTVFPLGVLHAVSCGPWPPNWPPGPQGGPVPTWHFELAGVEEPGHETVLQQNSTSGSYGFGVSPRMGGLGGSFQ